MKRTNLIVGVVALGIAIFFIWSAAKLPLGDASAPDVGFVPLWEAILLAAVALVLIAGGFRRDLGPSVSWPGGRKRAMVLQMSAALLAYVALVGYVGYITSTFLFMLAATSAWRRYSWRVVGASAVAFSILLFLVFTVLLKLPLPRNPLGLP